MEALLVGSRVVKLDFAGALSFYPEARTELLEAADSGDVRHTYLSISSADSPCLELQCKNMQLAGG